MPTLAAREDSHTAIGHSGVSLESLWKHGSALLAAALLQGCTLIQAASTSLGPPLAKQASPIAATAWIDKVDVLDPKLDSNRQLAASLALSIERYTKAAGYFSETKRLPGQVREGDYTLDFRFDAFSQTRRMHPAFIPGMFLTLTLYAWLGGPVYEDVLELSGTLVVLDSTGAPVGDAKASVFKKTQGNVYSRAALDSSKDRSTLIAELLANACAQLAQKHNAQ